LRVLKASRPPSNPLDVLSWDLPAALSSAQLVHIHQAFTRCGEVGMLVAKQQRKPICVSDHGGGTSPLVDRLGALELADRIIAYSDFGASLYRTRKHIDVIKGGVNAAHFAPPSSRPARDRVLFVGRLLPHKGIDQLIRALPPELPLTICGRPYHNEYLALLKSLAVGKQVEFVVDASDETLRSLYARAWATVLPSVYQDCFGNTHVAPELMGFTLLESMACGTPAIASRTGGMPEFIDEGWTGFVFDYPDELTGQLRLLAREPGLADEMGRRARKRVEEEYDLRVAGARLMAVYENLIAQYEEVAA
ncbi:MAG TPA: glycosyltransferase family 4 protein, partial [Isosphaeraceae bacterium]|nr:glycosyltransferase family 4 protein [Isosphaeraceae bacterium]